MSCLVTRPIIRSPQDRPDPPAQTAVLTGIFLPSVLVTSGTWVQLDLLFSFLPFLSLSSIGSGGRCCFPAPKLSKIPSSTSTRLPSNIPLRTLRHGRDNDSSASASLLSRPGDQDHDHNNGERYRRYSYSSGSESSWTDTGDIGERKGEDDDPLRLQLSPDVEEELLAGVQQRHRRQKKVRILNPSPRHHDRSSSPSVLIDKEAIEVPHVQIPTPSRTARCIGCIMSGRSANGLTGKALL